MANKQQKTKLSIRQLQPGIFIEIPGKWSSHPFIFNRFKLSSTQQISILRKCGFEYIYADLSKSTESPLPYQESESVAPLEDEAINQEIAKLEQKKRQQIEAMQQYRRSLKKCQDNYQSALSQVRSLCLKLHARPIEAIAQAQDVIESLNDVLSQQEDLVLHLVSDQRDNSDLHHHSLSVCVLAMLVGRYIGLNGTALVELGLAGLLHDIGKLKIPAHVYQGNTLPERQRQHIIRQHPQYSLEVLKLCPDINDNVKTAIAQHHEFADGSGYPARLTKAELDANSLIISLVNFYEGLRFPYNDEKAKPPAQALSHLFKFHKPQFDALHLGALIKTLGVYPPGTFVSLSNGQVGIVMSVTASKILTPQVMLFDPDVQRTEAPVIDTATEELTIEKAIAIEKVPEEIKAYLSPMEKSGIFIGS